MITEKDRGQLLRMAGNIAGGIMADSSLRLPNDTAYDAVAEKSARLAIKTLEAVDALLAQRAKKGDE
jgi:hypothetical protein